jgi:hypothetical protein
MSGTGYKALGFIVFKAAKAYLRYRYPKPKRSRVVPGALAALAVAGAVLVAQRRHAGDG